MCDYVYTQVMYITFSIFWLFIYIMYLRMSADAAMVSTEMMFLYVCLCLCKVTNLGQNGMVSSLGE